MGSEYLLAEKPAINTLLSLGYDFVPPAAHDGLRDGENQVLFRPHLIDTLQRLNNISEADARAAYVELSTKSHNEEWLALLRGGFSRPVSGQATEKTLHLVDFKTPANNLFTVTSQLYVKAEKSRIPDLVVHVNGIPLVVIEAKSPMVAKSKAGEAFDQIKQYERDIVRLFHSNLFNIVTDGTTVLYGATGAPAKFYGYWRDPWPRQEADFTSELQKGLWSLLEPSRLLDLLAHFTVFETDPDSGETIKKICRYQQFRAVNKVVDRVVEGKHEKGLIWHTQGSGKSLTMVFLALKLKTHLTLPDGALGNPNLMVLTDRIDLDDQISGTFNACGLPNPLSMESVAELRKHIHSGVGGLTVLSTIFKFANSKTAVPNSKDWIVMVDECHRTQENDLGAYLRATLPEARFFGFTGTPVKKNDRDTYANFGVVGEGYLDKYGIDDAVRDGATVPIHYTGRKTDWQIDEAKIDILFDQWFADLPDETVAKIKERGVQLADLVKHPKRIALIAFDIWTHFKAYAMPDGFKAQVVAIDREEVVLLKRALTKVIAEDLVKDGMGEEEARAQAASYAACVYSKSQEDDKPSEDPHTDAIRKDLVAWYLDKEAERAAKREFGKRGQPPHFLIVCDKLLTGFDAPAESVMYLDKPLKEHTLLQAIARTNRVADDKKHNGLIVDYIGVSNKLNEALASYRSEDVQNAMKDLDELRSLLRTAHAAVMALVKGVRKPGKPAKQQYDELVEKLKPEDAWIEFRRKAREFIGCFQALTPDPSALTYVEDLKWVAAFLQYATLALDKKQSIDHTAYSEKLRAMLEEHLEATGLSVTVKIRTITDPDFDQDFDTSGKSEDELKTAAIRKTTELKKTVEVKIDDNPHQYGKFSERLRKLLERLESGQVALADWLKEAEKFAQDLRAEDEAYKGTGLTKDEYGIHQVLQALGVGQIDGGGLESLAKGVSRIYAAAPPMWQEKPELRKDLRQGVRQQAHAAGLRNPKLGETVEQVEDYAVKHMARV
ncbi:MAG: type I restriction endonuclease subunit R [Nisaea sp.]|uniref:type I restriction endonuclease subunit R n=1 Tax=Nisaea sp. TaxID=2024842 RepID=UPI001B25EF96|nr:type I restriction endonuclease subunit R [Nisaea sp.]MBO6561151.1 type I restriction endonuclease subunit R [Nisaea sp.]